MVIDSITASQFREQPATQLGPERCASLVRANALVHAAQMGELNRHPCTRGAPSWHSTSECRFR